MPSGVLHEFRLPSRIAGLTQPVEGPLEITVQDRPHATDGMIRPRCLRSWPTAVLSFPVSGRIPKISGTGCGPTGFP